MWQQLLAIVIILFFLVKLWLEKRRRLINRQEFLFWLVFWLTALVLIILLKPLDYVAGQLGFSASGIQALLYLAVAILTYFIFRIRLRLTKIEQDISRLVEYLAIKKK